MFESLSSRPLTKFFGKCEIHEFDLRCFQKYDFQNATFSTLLIFTAKLFIAVPCDSPHKNDFLEFSDLKVKEKNNLKRD